MGDDLVEYYRSVCDGGIVERVEMVYSLRRVETAVSLRLEPLFPHLTVEPCLRAVPLSLEDCLAREPWVEDTWGTSVVRPRRILNICLLGCPPFMGLDPPQIWCVPESQKDPPRSPYPVACQNREALFDGLIQDLLVYQWGRKGLLPDGQELALMLLETRRALESYGQIPRELARQHRRYADQPDDMSPAEAVGVFEKARRIVSNTTAEDLQHTIAKRLRPAALRRQLVNDMAKDFAAHGPLLSEFPMAAVHATLAAILNSFGVCNQRGNSFKAAGIKSLLRSRPTRLRTRG
jgi:hypothetical protein